MIVDALTGKYPLERVQREFLLEKFMAVFKPRTTRGIPRWNCSFSDFLAALKRLTVTDELMAQWNTEWQELVRTCEKRAKMRKLNEVSIETLLNAKLQGTGIKYVLKKQQYRVTLTLTMNHNVQGTFYIQHSKFREQLDKVLPAVLQINQLMDELGQGIRIRAIDKRAAWKEV